MEFEQTNDTATLDAPAALPANCPDAEKLDRVANYIEKSVAAIVITTPAQYELAAQELQELSGKLERMTEERMKITRPIDAAKKAVMDLFRGPSERCAAAITTLKDAMLNFQRAEKVRIAEDQRQQQEAARKERIKAEQEQIAQRAEAERIAREAQLARKAAVDAEQKALEAAASGDTAAEEEASRIALEKQQEVARLASEAQAASDRNLELEQQTRVMAMGQSGGSGAPAVKGISTSEPWTAELENDSPATKLKVLKFVLENPQFISFIDISMKPIIQQAKSLQANCIIPGVRVFQQQRMSSRKK